MRRAVRSLARVPGFSVAVILTLALGLGANAALFAIVERVLLRPLPYDDAARLVVAGETPAPLTGRPGPVSAPVFLAWQHDTQALEALAAYRAWGFVLTGSGEPERVRGARVSAALFPLLGIRPIAGRAFTAADDRFGAAPVAIVSHALWARRLDSTADLAQRPLILNGIPYAIVGVMPAGFSLPEADVWVPLALEPFAAAQRGNRALSVIARVKTGSTAAQAAAELNAIAARSATGANAGWGAAALPLREYLVGPSRPTLFMAWGAVALLLLIACANTAGLMLGRAASRRREIAVCRALGASRRHLAAGVVGECLVLSLAGGLLGLPIALALLKVAVALAPPDLPRLDAAAIDLPVLAFTAALSVVTALVFGAVPAARGSRDGIAGDLRAGGGRGAVGAPHARLRQLAVSCQVALTIVVLVASALLLRSFARLVAVDPGFDGARVLTMTVSLPDAKYGDPGRRARFFQELAARARALPGVEAAGLVSHAPLAGAPLVADVRADEGSGGQARAVLANCSAIGGEWLAALGIPMVRGRAFTDRDRSGAPPVVIVSAHLAAALWPGVDPIGRRLVIGTTLGADPRPHEVVGVAGDVRSALEAGPGEQVYLPHGQNPWPTMTVMIRTTGPPSQWAAALRSAVYAIDPDQAVYNVRAYDDLLARALAARRFQLLVLSLFAGAGLLVAVTGVYSVVAYGVRERRQELGVRLALGARRPGLLWLTISSSLRWAAAGIACGSVIAVLTARTLSGALYEVAPDDTVSFVAASCVAAAMVMLGSLAGARGALTLDPLTSLRD